MKKNLLTALLAVALVVSAGIYSTGVSAQQPPQTFSVVAHFEYQNGFSFDYIVERGVAPSDVHDRLAYCGQSHWTGSVVWYHCFVIPE